MQNSIQKTAIALVVIATTLLVSGNVLMAEDRKAGDVITAADLAFIQAAPTGIAATVATDRPAQSAGLITPADYAFAIRAYAASSGILLVQATPGAVGIITAADYKFLTAGQKTDVFSAYSDLEDSLAIHVGK